MTGGFRAFWLLINIFHINIIYKQVATEGFQDVVMAGVNHSMARRQRAACRRCEPVGATVDRKDKFVPTQIEQLALGGALAVQVAAGHHHTMVVRRQGAVWACGYGASNQLVPAT